MNALITGATKGIGKAIALTLASEGYNLAICSRNSTELENFKQQIQDENPKIKVFIKEVDCGVKEQVLSFADDALSFFKTIDVLVNNAGLFNPSEILQEEDIDSLNLHMKTNVYAPYYLYKKIAPVMQKNGKGHIFNICSVASVESIVNAGSYCVTKSALLSLNNIMRQEMIPSGIKVTAILPGSTLSSSWEGTNIAPDNFIQPEDIALAVAATLKMSAGACVEQIILRPVKGQI